MKKKYDTLDALLDYLTKVKATNPTTVKNGEMYDSAVAAANKICNAVKACDSKAKISVDPDELFGTDLTITITSPLIVFDDLKPVVEGLERASVMEMVALKNGDIELNISFQNAYRLVRS